MYEISFSLGALKLYVPPHTQYVIDLIFFLRYYFLYKIFFFVGQSVRINFFNFCFGLVKWDGLIFLLRQ